MNGKILKRRVYDGAGSNTINSALAAHFAGDNIDIQIVGRTGRFDPVQDEVAQTFVIGRLDLLQAVLDDLNLDAWQRQQLFALHNICNLDSMKTNPLLALIANISLFSETSRLIEDYFMAQREIGGGHPHEPHMLDSPFK